MRMPDEAHISEKTLEILSYAITAQMSSEILLANDRDIYIEVGKHLAHVLSMHLKMRMPAEQIMCYKVESSGFQALKKRFYSAFNRVHVARWLSQVCPVRYNTFRVFMLRPDIPLPSRNAPVMKCAVLDSLVGDISSWS